MNDVLIDQISQLAPHVDEPNQIQMERQRVVLTRAVAAEGQGARVSAAERPAVRARRARAAVFVRNSAPGAPSRPRRVVVGGLATAVAAVAVMLICVVLPGTSLDSAPSASAAVLTRAATSASSLSPLPALEAGQYYYQANIELQGCTMQLPDGTFVNYLEPDTHKNWVASDGTGSVQLAAGPGGHWQTPQDQARWQAAGSPENGCVQTPSGLLPLASDAAILALPTDAKVLGSLIAQGRLDDVGQVLPPKDQCIRTDACTTAWQFDLVNNLLTSPVAVDRLGAVLYQILSNLPGVELIGTRTDALGRTGTAVEEPSSGDVVVLDPSTGILLETQSLAAPGNTLGLAPGTVTGSVTFGPISVVNGLGTLPN